MSAGLDHLASLPAAPRAALEAAIERQRARRAIALATLALLLTLVVAASIGPVPIDPLETLRIVLAHLGLPGGETAVGSANDQIVWQLRLPRVLTACLVGAALALSGVSYQAVFRNPLADPFLLGVAAGAALGAVAAIVSPLPLDYYEFGAVAFFAFLGAMGAVLLTYQLARVGWTVPVTAHVLAGVAVSAAAGAAMSFLMMLNQERLLSIFAWLYGDFTTAGWDKLASAAPYTLACCAALLLLGRQMNVLQLAEDEAASLGVRVERSRAIIILVASLATALCVATSGLIGFVGLIVPHACRLVCGPDHRLLLPLSALAGGAFLVLADLGARTLLSPQEVPVGIVTAATGAPFFLFLLRRYQRGLSQ